MNNYTKSCETCKWNWGSSCEKPGGNNCNWVGEMFRGEYNGWIDWEPSERYLNWFEKQQNKISISKNKNQTIIVINH